MDFLHKVANAVTGTADGNYTDSGVLPMTEGGPRPITADELLGKNKADDASSESDYFSDNSSDYGDIYTGPMEDGSTGELRLPGERFSMERLDHVQTNYLHYLGNDVFAMTIGDTQVLVASENSRLVDFAHRLCHVLNGHRESARLAHHHDALYDGMPWYITTCLQTTFPNIFAHPKQIGRTMREERNVVRAAMGAVSDADTDGSDPQEAISDHSRAVKRAIARTHARRPEEEESDTPTVSSPYAYGGTLRNRRSHSTGSAVVGMAATETTHGVGGASDRVADEPTGGMLLRVPVEIFYLFRMYMALAVPMPLAPRRLEPIQNEALRGVTGQLEAAHSALADRVEDFVKQWREEHDRPHEAGADMARVSNDTRRFVVDVEALVARVRTLQEVMLLSVGEQETKVSVDMGRLALDEQTQTQPVKVSHGNVASAASACAPPDDQRVCSPSPTEEGRGVTEI